VECKASENLWWGSLFKERDLKYTSLITSVALWIAATTSYIEKITSTVSENILPLKTSHAMNYYVPIQQDGACERQ